VYPVLFTIGSILIPAYGVMAALGVLLALLLAQRTARIVGLDTGAVWNLCVLSIFSALVASRLLLVLVNWSVLRLHPSWMLGLAMIHHPLLAGVGVLAGSLAALLYARRRKLPLAGTADALAAPLALGLAFEEAGALLAGSGFGTESSARWAVTYTNPLAARWSGAPLGVPVHPVQAYASLAWLAIAVSLYIWLPARRRSGDGSGLWLLLAGAAIYLTELWRDHEGRGVMLGGALDGPQVAAVVMVLLGGLLLMERKKPVESCAIPPLRQKEGARVGHGESPELPAKNEATHV
jgi:phosphatidylglycerol:prolipoprotein diacylglycerol transferase